MGSVIPRQGCSASSPAECVWTELCVLPCLRRAAGLQEGILSSAGPLESQTHPGQVTHPLCILTWLMTGVRSGPEARSPLRASSRAVSPARSPCSPSALRRLCLAWASSPGAPPARLAALLELRWAERMVCRAPAGTKATKGTNDSQMQHIPSGRHCLCPALGSCTGEGAGLVTKASQKLLLVANTFQPFPRGLLKH